MKEVNQLQKLVLLFALLIFLLFISGCAGSITTPVSKETMRAPTKTMPISTLSGTDVAPGNPNPTPSSTLSSTDTFTPTPGLVQNCLNILPRFPDSSPFEGKIVSETLNPVNVNSVFFVDLSTGRATKMQGTDPREEAISPNRSFLAYYDYGSKNLVLLSSEGAVVKSLPWEKDWGVLAGWLDNQRIIISTNELASPDSNFAKYPRSTKVLNPFINQVLTYSPDFPEIDRASHMLDWGGYGTTVYDPTLTKVIYPGYMKLKDYEGEGYILYDIPANKKLGQLPSGSLNKLPIWFPDGSKYIVFNDSEFNIVGVDGKISTLTKINSHFNPPQLNESNYLSSYYSLSPDGRQLALWLNNVSQKANTLAILNVDTGVVSDTCIKAGFNNDHLTRLPYPIWSPDGKALVVPANYREAERTNDVVVIDLEKEVAYKFYSDLDPIGWMVSKK